MRKPPRRDSFGYFKMCVLADQRRYERKWWKHPGFWAIFSYRVRRLRKFGPFGLKLLLLPLDIFSTLVRMQTSHCQLPATARIGPGLYLPHPDGVVLSDISRIGSEVAIFQQVTVGYWKSKSPIIHARAALFAGAKVFGKVSVGREALIGANAVVTKNVPAGYVAAGVPAEVRPANSVTSDVPSSIRNPMRIDSSMDVDLELEERGAALASSHRSRISTHRNGVAHKNGS